MNKRIAAFLLVIPASLAIGGAEPAFKKLPPGCFVTKSVVVPQGQTLAIGKRLGAAITRLSNSYLTVHGVSIQVNIIDTKTAADAMAVYKTIARSKGHPAFCVRRGKRVIEYVARDPALAVKTSYELGFVKKPRQVRYRIEADIVPLDKADYMSFNKLFNLFLRANTSAGKAEAGAEIKTLARKFDFGTNVTLRSPDLGRQKAAYRFVPEPKGTEKTAAGDGVVYSFDRPRSTLGVPYVTATMEITADASGLTPFRRAGGKGLLAATEFWPADDVEVRTLAKKITSGKRSAKAKVDAIIAWLAPGKNIRFGGPVTGSRWGVKQVLKQRFGQCWDFADCFVTLCRAAGAPCRQVGGWLYGTSGHIWAEAFIEGKGWQQFDATGGGLLTCGIYHIPYFTSETGRMPILYVSMPKIEILKTFP